MPQLLWALPIRRPGESGGHHAAHENTLDPFEKETAALSRADIPEAERRDFHLYVDEFGSYSTLAFVNILSEAQKYHLSLTVAVQYLSQTDIRIQNALLPPNVGTLVCFRTGAEDAERLSAEFEGVFRPSDLMNLGVGDIYLGLPTNLWVGFSAIG